MTEITRKARRIRKILFYVLVAAPLAYVAAVMPAALQQKKFILDKGPEIAFNTSVSADTSDSGGGGDLPGNGCTGDCSSDSSDSGGGGDGGDYGDYGDHADGGSDVGGDCC